jgi:hypothetical protein
MKRREFVGVVFALLASKNILHLQDNNREEGFLKKILDKANKNNWNALPFPELYTKIALEFVGFPYISNTLEKSEEEKCIITFEGFDCVTFFELALCIARIIRKNKLSYQDLVDEVTFTRYRNGNILDYTSRLHYSSDWIYDNISKGVVKDRTIELGGEKIVFRPSFMSENPNLYVGLKRNPSLVQKIKAIEHEIAERIYYYVPKEKISRIQNKIRNGDIIFFSTSKNGLDYSHVGICLVVDEERHLLHASSKKGKVVVDAEIASYADSVKNITGITVVEPLDPKK